MDAYAFSRRYHRDVCLPTGFDVRVAYIPQVAFVLLYEAAGLYPYYVAAYPWRAHEPSMHEPFKTPEQQYGRAFTYLTHHLGRVQRAANAHLVLDLQPGRAPRIWYPTD